MSPRKNIIGKLDWTLVICYLILVIFGWFNIFASVYTGDLTGLFSLSSRSGSQLIWIGVAVVLAVSILFFVNPRLYLGLSWWWYFFVIALLALVLVIGREVNGSKSWLMFGPFGLQPSELSKITTSLCLAVMMGKYGFQLKYPRDFIKVMGTLLIPIGLIALEPDMGTILVYCGFVFMLYREGLSGWFLIFIALIIVLFVVTLKYSPFVSLLTLFGFYAIARGFLTKKLISNIFSCGIFITAASFLPRLFSLDFMSPLLRLPVEYWLLIIILPIILYQAVKGYRRKLKHFKYLILGFLCAVLFVFSVEFIFERVLKEHHRDRIENLLGITQDLKGAGYNVNQSKIAIGSGGLWGKGFLQGTQTKFNFVPEQSTDFIFCTVGEEWGFVGSIGVLIVFFIIISNIILTAEKQKDKTARIYGYCLASCLFMHVFINIGMTIGIMPVVGIPLPFISYGGSSFLSFTILLFIFIRMDFDRWK